MWTQKGGNLLFPNKFSERKVFYPKGLVIGEKNAPVNVRMPYALQPGNQAGFHWDYTPPPGRDTLRVFASTDLETAETIRQFVQNLMPDPKVLTRGGLTSGFTSLGRELTGPRERGITTVPAGPEDSHLPGRLDGPLFR